MHRVICVQNQTKERQKQNHNFAFFLDSRGSRKFRLKPANLVAFKLSVFESRRISFLKIFTVSYILWILYRYIPEWVRALMTLTQFKAPGTLKLYLLGLVTLTPFKSHSRT